MASNDDTFAPGATFGRYQIVERLGEGGMGTVWKATHLALRKPVAIKTLKRDHAKNEQARARFLREGEAVSRVRHAHVVEVHDVGLVGNVPYLVMEFLEGEDLRSLFIQRRRLPLDELADVMVPVCAAVAAAHDEQVVHRDLKPENVFLAHTRDRGVVPKVLDFGISRVVDDDSGRIHTGTAALMGTPRYMSPEQARGERVIDERSDQYSLGVILYQGATGHFPIDDPALYNLLHRVIHGEFQPPRALCPELPFDFEAVVLRAMATRPDDRFASVRELGAALLPYASEYVRVLHGRAFQQLGTGAPPRASATSAPVDSTGATDPDHDTEPRVGPSQFPPPEPSTSTLGGTSRELRRPLSNRPRSDRSPLPWMLALGFVLVGVSAGVAARFVRPHHAATAPRSPPSVQAAMASASSPAAQTIRARPAPSAAAVEPPATPAPVAPTVSAASTGAPVALARPPTPGRVVRPAATRGTRRRQDEPDERTLPMLGGREPAAPAPSRNPINIQQVE